MNVKYPKYEDKSLGKFGQHRQRAALENGVDAVVIVVVDVLMNGFNEMPNGVETVEITKLVLEPDKD